MTIRNIEYKIHNKFQFRLTIRTVYLTLIVYVTTLPAIESLICRTRLNLNNSSISMSLLQERFEAALTAECHGYRKMQRQHVFLTAR